MANGSKTKWYVLGGLAAVVLLIIILVSWMVGMRNNMVNLEESVNSSWAQVQNQYQRRFDLIPNLVSTVKGYAEHEQETLQAVTEARSKAGGMVNVSPEILNDPQAFSRFQQVQENLGTALQRLMVVIERYPDLKANQNFLSLQAQLEGTENRISVERRRFNEAVQEYNRYIRRFPETLAAGMFGFEKKQYFQAGNEAQQAPKVEF